MRYACCDRSNLSPAYRVSSVSIQSAIKIQPNRTEKEKEPKEIALSICLSFSHTLSLFLFSFRFVATSARFFVESAARIPGGICIFSIRTRQFAFESRTPRVPIPSGPLIKSQRRETFDSAVYTGRAERSFDQRQKKKKSTEERRGLRCSRNARVAARWKPSRVSNSDTSSGSSRHVDPFLGTFTFYR